jgi:hypothetical protein
VKETAERELRHDNRRKQQSRRKVKEQLWHLPHFEQYHFPCLETLLPLCPILLSFSPSYHYHRRQYLHRCLNASAAIMSATLNEDMSNQEEEDQLKTLESYAALVKQLVLIINIVLRDVH